MTKSRPIFLVIIIFLIILSASFLYLFIKENKKNESFLEVYGKLNSDFGVWTNQLSLTSGEGDFSRGGYVRGEGIDQEGNIIKFYEDWGWCSSGGHDCGFVFCFSAPIDPIEDDNSDPDYVYELMKQNLCNGDYSYSWIEEGCESGKFEEMKSGRIIFSLTYTGNEDKSEGFEGKFIKGPTDMC